MTPGRILLSNRAICLLYPNSSLPCFLAILCDDSLPLQKAFREAIVQQSVLGEQLMLLFEGLTRASGGGGGSVTSMELQWPMDRQAGNVDTEFTHSAGCFIPEPGWLPWVINSPLHPLLDTFMH